MKHNNASIVSWANRIFSPKGESLNPAIANFIQPTIEVKPIANIVRHQTASTTGTITIFTTPSDKDFFLTSALLSFQCDATYDGGSVDISANVDGVNRNLLRISHIALTASQRDQVITFNPPIKIDRGTSITSTKTFTAGTALFSYAITGFTQETLSTFNN